MSSRWTTPDPCAERYYHLGPYTFCAADPINHSDPSGAIIQTMIGKLNYRYENRDGQWGFYCGDKKYEGGNTFADALNQALKTLQSKPVGNALVSSIVDAEEVVNIQQAKDGEGNCWCASTLTVEWDPFAESNSIVTLDQDYNAEIAAPSFIGLSHELFHAEYILNGGVAKTIMYISGTEVQDCEYWAVRGENFIRGEHGLDIRIGYGKRNALNYSTNGFPNRVIIPMYPNFLFNNAYFGHGEWMKEILELRKIRRQR